MSEARRKAVQIAFAELSAYLLDECPDGEFWEDFDWEIDLVRSQLDNILQGNWIDW